MAMNCPKCDAEVLKLIIPPGEGLCCENCFSMPPASMHTPGLHIKGENKYAPHMSRMQQMHIKTRKIDKDGVVRSHPRYETKDY